MANLDSDDEFMWGEAKRTLNKKKKFYYSFFYEDEEYRLYDNVLLHDENEPEPHVGKIMKLWEDIVSGRKMALIRWYLRRDELPHSLQGHVLEEASKELFLCFGKGKGVTNENKLDSIHRKCKVLCTCKDIRNKQPSEDDLKQADYFFYRIYNVDRQKLSNVEGIVDVLGCDVVFNKPEWISSESSKLLHERDAGTSGMHKTHSAISEEAAQRAAEGGKSDERRASELEELGLLAKKVHYQEHRTKPEVSGLKRPNQVPDKSIESPTSFQSVVKPKTFKKHRQTTKDSSELLHDVAKGFSISPSSGILHNRSMKAAKLKETEPIFQKDKTRSLENDKPSALQEALPSHGIALSGDPMTRLASSRLHQENPSTSGEIQYGETASAKKAWDVNLQQALSHGRVLLLQNIDLSFTSADVCDLVSSVFKGCHDAQIIPQLCAAPAPYGEALVIFENKGLAELAFQELEDNCLILTGSRRPLIASKVKPPEAGKVARFPGHFPMDNFKLSKQPQNEAMTNPGIATLFSQLNAAELEMAMEWRYYQEMASGCWRRLHKVQMDDISAILRNYRKAG